MLDAFSQQKTLQTLRWIVRARYIFAIGVLLLLVFATLLSFQNSLVILDQPVLFIMVVILFVYNTFYWIVLKKQVLHSDKWVLVLVFLQPVIDQIMFAIVVHYTGGVETQSFMFYVLPFFMAALLLQGFSIMVFAAFTVLLHVNVVLLEYFRILPHYSRYSFSTGIFENEFAMFGNTVVVVIMILIVGALAMFVSQIIREREEAIWAERDKVSSLFDNFPDGLVMFDTKKRILLVNPVAEKWLNVSSDELMGASLYDVKNDVSKKLFSDIMLHPVSFDKDREGFEIFDYEIKEPNKMFLQISTVFVRDGQGKVLGRMKVLHDATRERAIDSLKSEFISVAAHQLRTPLSAIKWVLKLLMDGDAGKPTKEQVDMLQKGFESNERMIRLVNDLLDVSRIEEGRFQYSFSVGSVLDLVKSVAEEQQGSIKDRDVDFSMKFDSEGLPDIRFDATKLRLAVQNLIDNAIRYTPKKGKIQVHVGFDGDKNRVFISVKDSGAGVPEDQKEKLFTKFFRADNVVRMQTEGSGLGLFIVKNVVEKHDGEVTFESEYQKGSKFIIWLPPVKAPEIIKSDFDTFMKKLS